MTSIIVIAAVLGAIFVVLRLRGSGERSAAPPRALDRHTPTASLASRNRTMAVLHVPDMASACDFARHQAGTACESANAPALPLPGCTRVNCQCHYERVLDRRRGERRSGEERRDAIRFPDSDRRENPDRRRSVRPWQRKEH